MNSLYKEQRDLYKPEKIKYVFVFESPPQNGGYFYDLAGSPKEILFRNIMLTLFDKSFPDKNSGLTVFKEHGFILVDLSYQPVNKKSEKERIKILQESYAGLCEDLNRLIDSDTKLILNMRHVTNICLENNIQDQYNLINKDTFIPFPKHYHFSDFKSKIRVLLFGDESKYIQT